MYYWEDILSLILYFWNEDTSLPLWRCLILVIFEYADSKDIITNIIRDWLCNNDKLSSP